MNDPREIEAFRQRMEERGKEAVQASLDAGLYGRRKAAVVRLWLAGELKEPAEPDIVEDTADDAAGETATEADEDGGAS